MKGMTVCPSGEGDGLEIRRALAAGAPIPSLSFCLVFERQKGPRGLGFRD